MLNHHFSLNRRQLWPWLTIALVLLLSVYLLRSQGRLWICACGQVYLWTGDVWSSDNSQHWFDPYSFTHLLHGVVFCGLLAWLTPPARAAVAALAGPLD